MKSVSFTTPLFVPDILEYIQGREEVCRIVLATCQLRLNESQGVTLKSKIFEELHFSVGDVLAVMLEAAKKLMIKLSYSLILQQHEAFTVEDLASQLWKYMCRLVKAN